MCFSNIWSRHKTQIIVGLLCLALSSCLHAQSNMMRSQYESNPDWSPRGSVIADECIVEPLPISDRSTTDICTMNSDGTAWQRLTKDSQNNVQPTWSPNGKMIAFISDRLGQNDVYIMRPDGNDQQRLTFHGGVARETLTWSPDSEFIAYTAELDSRQVYKVNIHTHQVTRLTDTSLVQHNSLPQWSPDGQAIAFVSDHDGKSAIYLMRPDGTEQTSIGSYLAGGEEPVWSPDGMHLAFVSYRSDSGNTVPGWWIYVVDMREVENKLPRAVAEGRWLAWAPNGEYLAFISTTRAWPEPSGLYIVQMGKTGAKESYLASISVPFRLTWSSDSMKIAFTTHSRIKSPGEDPPQIWTINRDGSDLRRLTPVDSKP